MNIRCGFCSVDLVGPGTPVLDHDAETDVAAEDQTHLSVDGEPAHKGGQDDRYQQPLDHELHPLNGRAGRRAYGHYEHGDRLGALTEDPAAHRLSVSSWCPSG